MSSLCRSVPLLVAVFFVNAFAAEATDFTAVGEADQQRLALTLAGDTAKLSDLLSDELHYAHPDGRVQTKAQLIAAVASNKVKYLSFVPYDVAYQSISAGAVAMNGCARLTAETGGQHVQVTLRFLAVWRQESGHWRLLAYQSSQLAEAVSGAPK